MIVIDNNAIHIVDSVMGTGKTQACIAWMRQHPEQKYLYVTPYLDECSRIQASAPELDFQQPQENKTKSADLLRLLSEGKNITTTHELLSLMKDSDVEYSYFRKTGLASKAIALESTSFGIMPIILSDINAKRTKRMCYGHPIRIMRTL